MIYMGGKVDKALPRDLTICGVRNWMRLKSTHSLLSEFSQDTSYGCAEPIVTRKLRSESTGEFIPGGGTFAHPDIAIQFAQWCDPRFALPIWLPEKLSEPYSFLSKVPKALIDGGSGDRIFVYPNVAIAYAMSDPKFFARVTLWITNHREWATVNPHHLDWSVEESERGIQLNRDDIHDLYGR